MASEPMNLEEMYARLALEEDGGEGLIIGKEEGTLPQKTFVLIGRFLTEKNINFQAMQNVLASIWRPKEGMEVHDLGGQRYSFVFYHVLDLQKVIEGGPWTFEQNLLLHHKLEEGEDAHLVKLNRMEIWVQIYDLPMGMLSIKLLESIGNYVGAFVKTDPKNLTSGWKMFVRIRVVMDIDKPLKRKMKIKREGGNWTWINFKYERLSSFCFVCGLMGHTDRDCGIVYANPDKVIERAYGTWLRAPTKNEKNQNIGARWLRNGVDGHGWGSNSSESKFSATDRQAQAMGERFMEIDGRVTENLGKEVAICFTQRDQGDIFQDKDNTNEEIIKEDGKNQMVETVVIDTKRKRVDKEYNIEIDGLGMLTDGPKNGSEAGPVIQARLQQ